MTMLIGGLWHGAGWNWVVWGGFHGVGLSIERVLGLPERAKSVWGNGLRWLLTLNLVSFSWVLFRSQDMGKAIYICKKLFTLADGSMTISMLPLLYLIIIVFVERLNIREQWLAFCEEYPSALKWLVYCSVVVLIFTFAGVKNPEFIYFQF
jgi:alginate O-acetyltransferase complex protein AlgI